MSSGKTTIPFLIFLTGILLVLLSVFRGEADVALILFIPVISGGGLFISIGILLIFLSFFLFFILNFLINLPVLKQFYSEVEKILKKDLFPILTVMMPKIKILFLKIVNYKTQNYKLREL